MWMQSLDGDVDPLISEYLKKKSEGKHKKG